MAKSKRPLGSRSQSAQPEANPIDALDLSKHITPEIQRYLDAFASDPSLNYRGHYHASPEEPDIPSAFLPIDSQGNQGSPLGLRQNEMLVLPPSGTPASGSSVTPGSSVTSGNSVTPGSSGTPGSSMTDADYARPMKAHAPTMVAPSQSAPSQSVPSQFAPMTGHERMDADSPWFESLYLQRHGIPADKVDLYRRVRDGLYSYYGKTVFSDQQLKDLQRQFQPKREIAWEVPQTNPKLAAVMPFKQRGVSRNYDPETGVRVPMGQIPEGAVITGHKNYGDAGGLSPRVTAEIERMKVITAGQSVPPLTSKPLTKKKGALESAAGSLTSALGMFGGLLVNAADAPAYLIERGLNAIGATHIPEARLDAQKKEMERRTFGAVNAYINPQTPEEATFSVGMDALITGATLGIGNLVAKGAVAAMKGLNVAEKFAAGMARSKALASALHAVKTSVYDPFIRGKVQFSPEEAHRNITDTYGAYSRHLDDDTVQRLAYALNATARDAAFDRDPSGLGKHDIHLQAVAYGLDNVARLAGNEPSSERDERMRQIGRLAPMLVATDGSTGVSGGACTSHGTSASNGTCLDDHLPKTSTTSSRSQPKDRPSGSRYRRRRTAWNG